MPHQDADLIHPDPNCPDGYGRLCHRWCHRLLPLQVCQSAAGFYIGTQDHGEPYSRESVEYWQTYDEASRALRRRDWQQRPWP